MMHRKFITRACPLASLSSALSVCCCKILLSVSPTFLQPVNFCCLFHHKFRFLLCCVCPAPPCPQRGTAGAKVEAPSARNLDVSKVLVFKLGMGQNRTLHASHTARNFSLSKFYLIGLFNFICSESVSQYFPGLGVAKAG